MSVLTFGLGLPQAPLPTRGLGLAIQQAFPERSGWVRMWVAQLQEASLRADAAKKQQQPKAKPAKRPKKQKRQQAISIPARQSNPVAQPSPVVPTATPNPDDQWADFAIGYLLSRCITYSAILSIPVLQFHSPIFSKPVSDSVIDSAQIAIRRRRDDEAITAILLVL